MKKSISFIALLIFTHLFFFVGCSDKNEKKPIAAKDTVAVKPMPDLKSTSDTSSRKDSTSSKKTNKVKPVPIVSKSSKDSSDFVIYKYTAKVGDCLKKDGSCAEIDLSYALFNSKDKNPVHEKINRELINRFFLSPIDGIKYSNVETFCNSVYKSYYEANYGEPEYHANYSVDQDLTLFVKGNYLVATIGGYSYSGGAHGISGNTFTVFSLSTGNIVKLTDVITNKSDKQLLKKAEAAFRKSKNIKANVPLSKEGYFEGGTFFIPDNFSLKKDGILFYYNSYEIAAYAAGPSEFMLSYSELESFLKPEFKSNYK